MKRLFTLLALSCATFFSADAQKNIDLEISFIAPVDNQTFPNLNNGDTFNFQFKIANLGTDTLVGTDTMFLWMAGHRAKLSGGLYPQVFKISGDTIAPNDSKTYNFNPIKGNYVVVGSDTVINYFPDDAYSAFWFTGTTDTMSYYIDVYGYDANNKVFNDVGITHQNDSVTAWEGNNVAKVRKIKFGTPTSIDAIKGLEKSALSVYPNPARNAVNFDYNFAKAAVASVRVLDLMGRQVYTESLGKQAAGLRKFNIDVAAMPNGLYTIEFIAGDKRAISKFNISK